MYSSLFKRSLLNRFAMLVLVIVVSLVSNIVTTTPTFAANETNVPEYLYLASSIETYVEKTTSISVYAHYADGTDSNISNEPGLKIDLFGILFEDSDESDKSRKCDETYSYESNLCVERGADDKFYMTGISAGVDTLNISYVDVTNPNWPKESNQQPIPITLNKAIKVLPSYSISTTGVTKTVGKTDELQVQVATEYGKWQDVTSTEAIYSSSSPEVVSVSSTGVVKWLSVGSAYIKVSWIDPLTGLKTGDTLKYVAHVKK